MIMECVDPSFMGGLIMTAMCLAFAIIGMFACMLLVWWGKVAGLWK